MTVIQAKPGQALLLWNLLITGEEPAMSKAKPELKPAERRSLVDAGLIQLERRGRSQHLVLTDRAWDWAVENFDVELAKTPSSSPVLQKLLLLLGKHLQSHHVSLSSFLRPASATANSSDEAASTAEDAGAKIEVPTSNDISNDIEEKIRQAYMKIANDIASKGSEVGVRLAELRQQLKFTTAEIDTTLRQMQLAGELVLMPLEDPTAITPEDEQAAVDIDGYKYHIVQKR